MFSYYYTLSLPRHYLFPGKSMMMAFYRLLKIISRKYADFIFPTISLLNRHFRVVNISSKNSVLCCPTIAVLSLSTALSLPRHYLVPGKSMLMAFHRLLKIISRKYADFIFPIYSCCVPIKWQMRLLHVLTKLFSFLLSY